MGLSHILQIARHTILSCGLVTLVSVPYAQGEEIMDIFLQISGLIFWMTTLVLGFAYLIFILTEGEI